MLDVNGLSISYNSVEVVHEVTLHIEEGRIVALIGANGAGKSSVLRAVSGLIRPSRGDIVFQGVSLVGVPPHDIAAAGIGHVMEGRHLFGGLSVEDNLLLATAGKAGGLTGNMEAVFKRWPILSERRHQPAGILSGGEQQLLAIGRALMGRPRMLMLDEPSWGLAPKVVRALMETIQQLRAEGMTILLVEQMAKIALKICDSGYAMSNGRVILEGTGQELLDHPELHSSYLGGDVRVEKPSEKIKQIRDAAAPQAEATQTPRLPQVTAYQEKENAMLKEGRKNETVPLTVPTGRQAQGVDSALPFAQTFHQREQVREDKQQAFQAQHKLACLSDEIHSLRKELETERIKRQQEWRGEKRLAQEPAPAVSPKAKTYGDSPGPGLQDGNMVTDGKGEALQSRFQGLGERQKDRQDFIQRQRQRTWEKGEESKVKILVPYETAEHIGNVLELELPEGNLKHSFIPYESGAVRDIGVETSRAIERPLGCRPLSQLVGQGSRVVIITENQFRAAPADQILPSILRILRSKGAEVKIVIGNGKVPPPSPEELVHILGEEIIASGIPVECNDVSKPENYIYLGITSRGVPLYVLKSVVEADVRIAVSTTQATLWGYGGSGMIIPAVAGNETIEMNHMFSLSGDCRPGNNACHMQEDKYEGARMARIDLGVHVIVNNQNQVTYVGAGEFVEAHKTAVSKYDQIYRLRAASLSALPADIVITGSSAPTDHLFFHTGWAVVNCDPICKDGGTIIQATPCPGYGDWPGFALMDLMKDYMPPSAENAAKALRAFYNKDRELWAGCIWWKIYDVMTRKQVVIVTERENLELARSAGLEVTDSLAGAFEAARKRHGANARVAFVPYGRYTVLDVE